MEIETTIGRLPEKIRDMALPPNTPIRVTIERTAEPVSSSPREKSRKPYLPFIHSEKWHDPDGPTDISQRVDDYLYDEDKIHG